MLLYLHLGVSLEQSESVYCGLRDARTQVFSMNMSRFHLLDLRVLESLECISDASRRVSLIEDSVVPWNRPLTLLIARSVLR